jgi:hypothetical protein
MTIAVNSSVFRSKTTLIFSILAVIISKNRTTMNNIEIDTREAIAKLKHLQSQLTASEVASATRMAINDATRWGKTRVKEAIRTQYNLKPGRITDSNPKKGLSVGLATNDNLTARIKAGHTPANLSSFVGTKFPKGRGVSVEIRKGQRKNIASGFGLKVSTGVQGASGTGDRAVAFARGRYGNPRFQFGKARKPMSALSSISVATAAANTNAIKHYEPAVSQRFQEQLIRQLNRLIDKGTR